MKVLFTADWHIKLGQKHVKKDWQKNRFRLLFDALIQEDYDILIIGGDIFDKSNPTIEELSLFMEFVQKTNIEKTYILFPGNHEATSKYTSCLRHLKPMLPTNIVVVDTFSQLSDYAETGEYDADILPYNELHRTPFPEAKNSVLFTHVRGKIPPHVSSEVDLSLFRKWEVVYAGDLHDTKLSQENICYPGSPFNTSFTKTKPRGQHGYYIIDFSIGGRRWIELKLPQMLRVQINNPEDIDESDYDLVTYELITDDEQVLKNTTGVAKKTKLVQTREVKVPELARASSLREELGVYLEKVDKRSEEECSKLLDYFSRMYLATEK